MNWKKAISSVAPTLGTAIGGPFGGMAAKFVTDALGLPCGADDDEIADAVRRDPEALVKLKKAGFDFEVRLKELDIKAKELVYKDIDSARSREAAVGSAAVNNLATFLVVLVVIVLIGLGVLVYYDKLTAMSAIEASIVTLVVREVFGKLEQSCNYFFGSSHGSSKKNDIIKDLKNRD